MGEKGDGQGHREKDEVAEDRLGVEGAAGAGGLLAEGGLKLGHGGSVVSVVWFFLFLASPSISLALAVSTGKIGPR